MILSSRRIRALLVAGTLGAVLAPAALATADVSPAPVATLTSWSLGASTSPAQITATVTYSASGRYSWYLTVPPHADHERRPRPAATITGARVPLLAGSRLGARRLAATMTAPVTQARAGEQVTLVAFLAAPLPPGTQLHVVRRASDGTLAGVAFPVTRPG